MKKEKLKIIYINGRFLLQNITGVQRYAHEIIKAIDKVIDDDAIYKEYIFILLCPKKIKYNLQLKYIKIRELGFFNGHFWEQIELPFFTWGSTLINLCNTGPIFKRKQIVTIHDASVYGFPKAYSFAFKLWYQILLKILGFQAQKIITDSEFSSQELKRYCKIHERKIKVIKLGKEHIFSGSSDSRILEKHNLQKDRFILAVSSLNPNKNFNSIIRAIELLQDNENNYDFVIAGGINPGVFSKTECKLLKNVKHVGYISDEELKTLYENAACFIYPSFYEGFGLPPLEALACECPVIVSNTSSLPEVCDDAALYCNPYNPQDIADKLQLLMMDDTLKNTLRKKGLERSKEFTWLKCAEETVDLIKEVAK